MQLFNKLQKVKHIKIIMVIIIAALLCTIAGIVLFSHNKTNENTDDITSKYVKSTEGMSEFTLDKTIKVKTPKGWAVDEIYTPNSKDNLSSDIGFKKESQDKNITSQKIIYLNVNNKENNPNYTKEGYEKLVKENDGTIDCDFGKFYYKNTTDGMIGAGEYKDKLIFSVITANNYVHDGDTTEEPKFTKEDKKEFIKFLKSVKAK